MKKWQQGDEQKEQFTETLLKTNNVKKSWEKSSRISHTLQACTDGKHLKIHSIIFNIL